MQGARAVRSHLTKKIFKLSLNRSTRQPILIPTGGDIRCPISAQLQGAFA